MPQNLYYLCPREACGYEYQHKLEDGIVVRTKGYHPPLRFRLLSICESVVTEQQIFIPDLPFLVFVCPQCGHMALSNDQDRTNVLIQRVKLDPPPMAKKQDDNDSPPPLHRGLSWN